MKSKTLKENKDFRRLYYKGKSRASSCIVTYAAKSGAKGTRIGITASKKSAVQLNETEQRELFEPPFLSLREELTAAMILFLLHVQKPQRLKCRKCLSKWNSTLKHWE